jgi:hypothetical protein
MRFPEANSARPISRSRSTGARHLLHHELSRRAFIRGSAGAAGLALGSGLLQPLSASAARPGTGQPKPIPGGIQPLP